MRYAPSDGRSKPPSEIVCAASRVPPIARAVAAFRVWLEDFRSGVDGDPLEHLDEVLAAG